MPHLEVMVQKCTNSTPPVHLLVTSATVSGFLLLVTVPVNLLVCLAILIDPYRQLRTQFNIFRFNLALADLITGCVTEPASVYVHVKEAMTHSRGDEATSEISKMFYVPYFISSMTSVLSIAALASERYLAVTSPFRYRKYFDVKVAAFLAILIWITGISFGLLNLTFNLTLESFLLVNSGFLFTFAVACFSKCRVHSALRQATRQLKEQGMKSATSDMVQNKFSKSFTYMIAGLIFSYVPATSMVYYVTFCTECDCQLVVMLCDVIFWLVLLNSATNPYVHAIGSRAFRRAIVKIACSPFRRRDDEKIKTSWKWRTRFEKTTGGLYGSVVITSNGNDGI